MKTDRALQATVPTKRDWSKQRSNDNDADKVGCQFSCVFQGG